MNQMKYLTVKDLPVLERPYEKCERFGASALSDAELIAAIIKTGAKNVRSVDLAHHVLSHSPVHSGLQGLNYLSLEELMNIKGIGKIKAIQLLCIVELTKRMAKSTNEEGYQLLDPESVANYYMQEMRHRTAEAALVVFIDSKSKVLKDMIISLGTVNSSIIAPREIFLNALRYGAASILLLHNHPSGDPAPSKEDINTTQRLKEAGMIIGIKLMDHIIIGDNKFVSLKERGIL